MKLKYIFESVDMGDEIILVPIGQGAANVHGVLKLNTEGKEILDLLKSDTTQEKIIGTLATKYENDVDSIASYVNNVLDVLRSAELLDE